MLSLGSPKLDARELKRVQRRSVRSLQLGVDPEYLHRYVPHRLRWLAGDVSARIPHFRDRGLSRVAEAEDPCAALESVPLLEKPQLRELIHAVPANLAARCFVAETSGSTGTPLRMLLDQEQFASYSARFRHFLNTLSLWPEPASMSLMTISVFKKIRGYTLLQPCQNRSFYRTVNIHPDLWPSSRAIVEDIAAERSLVLRGMPTSLEALADHVEDYRGTPRIRPAAVITFAETLLPGTRSRLERTFDCPVFDHYGLTELGGMVASECPVHEGFHVYPQDYYVEVVDPLGRRVEDGREGEILVTNLFNRLVPIIRYRTGDWGTMGHEPCACGSVTPRIRHLAGRNLCRFKLPDGSSYNPFDAYGEYLWKLPLVQFQMIQEDGGLLTLRYRSHEDIGTLELTRELEGKVRVVHGGGASLEVERVERFEVDVAKFHAFLSRC